jgi:hypothetical protein
MNQTVGRTAQDLHCQFRETSGHHHHVTRGKRLSIMCHVQNKNITKEQKFPGIMVRAQEKVWMDSEFILDLI